MLLKRFLSSAVLSLVVPYKMDSKRLHITVINVSKQITGGWKHLFVNEILFGQVTK